MSIDNPKLRDAVIRVLEHKTLNADAAFELIDGYYKAQANKDAWWITTNVKDGGKKLLGPFESRDLAMSVRTYVEMANTPETYWVEELNEQTGEEK